MMAERKGGVVAFLELLGWALAVGIGYMTAAWAVSLVLRNAGVADSFWGPGFVVLAAALPWIAGGPTWRCLLVLAMVAVWAARLATHVTLRNRGKPEDWRYKKWRDAAGSAFWWRSYLKVFLLQGTLLVVVAAPILVVSWARGPASWGLLDVIGAALWLLGLTFEGVGDAQLVCFKRDPENQGRVMDRGLWRYTRHPNYFGEALLWWGIYLVTASVPFGWAAIVGPGAITFLLVRVSGVRMLEQGLRARRPGYEEYVRRTSAFVPWPPRRSSGAGEGSRAAPGDGGDS
jgi:steroid 5-alpha reductase family enzyme